MGKRVSRTWKYLLLGQDNDRISRKTDTPLRHPDARVGVVPLPAEREKVTFEREKALSVRCGEGLMDLT